MRNGIALIGCLLLVVGCGGNSPDPASLEPATVTRPVDDAQGPTTVRVERPRSYPNERPLSPATRDPRETSAGGIEVFFSDVWGTPAVNRANPRSIADQCAAFIRTARQSLDVCCYEINNPTIIDAIVERHQAGVRVRVVTETDYIDRLGPTTFRRVGIPVLSDHRSALMHNKFLIADERVVWTGSFNLTDNDAYKNNNNAVILRDHRLAANYGEKFSWFWEYKKFGGRPGRAMRIPYPIVKMDDGTVVENYFSPHDGVDQKVIDKIAEARRSIKFMAFSFTHAEIAQAMMARADQGVRVMGVCETRQESKSSEYERLSHHPGCEVVLDGNKYNMHHKVIIIDDALVITGSYNFSSGATRDNDENIVFINDVRLARRYDEEFARVYRAGAGAMVNQPSSAHRR